MLLRKYVTNKSKTPRPIRIPHLRCSSYGRRSWHFNDHNLTYSLTSTLDAVPKAYLIKGLPYRDSVAYKWEPIKQPACIESCPTLAPTAKGSITT